jgi:hypothetical protein
MREASVFGRDSPTTAIGARTILQGLAMSFHVSDHISWCVCAGQAVFLDLRRDRYVSLHPPQNAMFLQWVRTGIEQDGLSQLARLGLLTAGPPRAPMPVSYPPPIRDARTETSHRIRLGDILDARLAWWRASVSLRRRRLSDIVDELESDTATEAAAADVDARVARIAATFASMALSFSAADQCLARALAAGALCRRAGAHPAIIFGVRMDPFAAHCWLQLNDAVVVGDLEEARMFTPIRVIS